MATLTNFNFKSLVNPVTGKMEMPENDIILEALNAWAEDNNEGVTFTLEGARIFSTLCAKVLEYYYAENFDKYNNIEKIGPEIVYRVATIPGYVDKTKTILLDIHANLLKLISPSSIMMAEDLRQSVQLGINYLIAELLCLIEAIYQHNETEMTEHAENINNFINTIKAVI